MKLSVVFDFDGVISENKNGWCGPLVIDEKPVQGIKEAIDEISKEYKIVILSHRCSSESGKDVLKEWLDGYEIKYDELTNTKPEAVAYIDDKAIYFNGNTKTLLEEIKNLTIWNNDKDGEFLDYKLQPGDLVEFEIFKGAGVYTGEIRFEFKILNHFNSSYNNTTYYKIRSNFNSYDVPYSNIIKKVG